MSDAHSRKLFADLVVSALREKMSTPGFLDFENEAECYLPDVTAGNCWCGYVLI